MPIDRTKFLALAFGLGVSLSGCVTTKQHTRDEPAPNQEGYKDEGEVDPCGEGDCDEHPTPDDPETEPDGTGGVEPGGNE